MAFVADALRKAADLIEDGADFAHDDPKPGIEHLRDKGLATYMREEAAFLRKLADVAPSVWLTIAGDKNTAAPADAERLALAENIEKYCKAIDEAGEKGWRGAVMGDRVELGRLTHENRNLIISSLRAGGWREDMAAFGMRAYALCEPDGKHWRVVVGFQSLSDAQSALTAVANFPSAPHTNKER